jgi:D-alanyl-D-alanine carboxypeptidase (penicillin-binding protein 5/6)
LRSLAAGAAVAALAPAATAPAPEDRFPRAAASYLVTLDGRVLWERDPDTPRPPASLAKIMTALVLLEGGLEPEAVVTVSADAAAATGSRLGLRAGETVRAGDLLTALLVSSANDAAIALAEHASGSLARFVEAMNRTAEEHGLAATRFVNPTGLDAEGQVSSARDLGRLAEIALARPELARRVALERAQVATVAGRRFDLRTSNALLGRLEGAIGVKTGFTSLAGKCIVALVERDGHRVLCVLLDAPERFWAADAMIREALDAARAEN